MTWIEKKKWFEQPGGNGKKPQKIEQSFSVSEVAKLLGVSRQTIFKYLALDEPNDAVIPPAAWYRLPSGHIRIHAWIVSKLQETA
jgi:predicted transcriptional regulator